MSPRVWRWCYSPRTVPAQLPERGGGGGGYPPWVLPETDWLGGGRWPIPLSLVRSVAAEIVLLYAATHEVGGAIDEVASVGLRRRGRQAAEAAPVMPPPLLWRHGYCSTTAALLPEALLTRGGAAGGRI